MDDIVIALIGVLVTVVGALAFMGRLQAKVTQQLTKGLVDGLGRFSETLGSKLDKLIENITDLKVALLDLRRDLNTTLIKMNNYNRELQNIRREIEDVREEIKKLECRGG